MAKDRQVVITQRKILCGKKLIKLVPLISNINEIRL